MNIQVVEEWEAQIPEIIEHYSPVYIFNIDETGIFFKKSSDHSLVLSGDDRTGNKKFKDRMTVLLCCNMVGDKLKLMVIGKRRG